MALTSYDLKLEKEVLRKEYETLNVKLTTTEKEIGQIKSNMNAVYGAIQLLDRLIGKVASQKIETEKEKPSKKKKKENE